MSEYPDRRLSRLDIRAADKFNTCQPHVSRENQTHDDRSHEIFNQTVQVNYIYKCKIILY